MRSFRIGLVAVLALAATASFAQSPQPTSPMPPPMSTNKAVQPPAKPMAPAPAPAAAQTAPKATLLDVNSATKKEMIDGLPGIGDVRADAIVKNRPYKGKDDIVGKAGVPRPVYDKIKDKIIAKQK